MLFSPSGMHPVPVPLHTQAGPKGGQRCWPNLISSRRPHELCHVATASFHLLSWIMFLQKVPLFRSSCLRWCWWRGSFHNHCLHLRLLRKCCCHVSSKHAAQRWTGPNCQDDSEGLRLAIIRLRSKWLPCLHRDCVESCFFSKDGLQTTWVRDCRTLVWQMHLLSCYPWRWLPAGAVSVKH